MGIFKRAHIRGMAHELTVQGLVTWPSKLAEDETADAVADDMEEEEVPEVTGEEGLTEEQAALALQKIVQVAEEIAAKTGGARDVGINKTAASLAYQDVASTAAVQLMHKAAEETAVATGPDVPGQNAPAPDLGATAEGQVDAAKVPSATRVGPKGTSDIDTRPGAVGAETVREDQPGAEANPPTGEVAKTAQPLLKSLEDLLSKMSQSTEKVAMDGASLSGGATAGPAPTPRLDLTDNLLIPGVVASGRGQTSQDVPAAANVGTTLRQPAGTPGPTAETSNKPATDAYVKSAMDVLNQTEEGRVFLHKLAQAALQTQQIEVQRGAAFGHALRNLASTLGR